MGGKGLSWVGGKVVGVGREGETEARELGSSIRVAFSAPWTVGKKHQIVSRRYSEQKKTLNQVDTELMMTSSVFTVSRSQVSTLIFFSRSFLSQRPSRSNAKMDYEAQSYLSVVYGAAQVSYSPSFRTWAKSKKRGGLMTSLSFLPLPPSLPSLQATLATVLVLIIGYIASGTRIFGGPETSIVSSSKR